jgi:hypothetical protein
MASLILGSRAVVIGSIGIDGKSGGSLESGAFAGKTVGGSPT